MQLEAGAVAGERASLSDGRRTGERKSHGQLLHVSWVCAALSRQRSRAVGGRERFGAVLGAHGRMGWRRCCWAASKNGVASAAEDAANGLRQGYSSWRFTSKTALRLVSPTKRPPASTSSPLAVCRAVCFSSRQEKLTFDRVHFHSQVKLTHWPSISTICMCTQMRTLSCTYKHHDYSKDMSMAHAMTCSQPMASLVHACLVQYRNGSMSTRPLSDDPHSLSSHLWAEYPPMHSTLISALPPSALQSRARPP